MRQPPSIFSARVFRLEASEPVSGSVRPKQPSASPEQSLRQPLLLLLLGAPAHDRRADERGDHRDHGAHGRVAAAHLLHDQPVRAVVHATAAVLLGHDRAEEADVRDLLHELGVEVLVAVVLARARNDLVVGEVACRLADQALLVGQLEVDQGSPGRSWLHRARIVADRVYGRPPCEFRVEEACATAARVHPDGRRGRRNARLRRRVLARGAGRDGPSRARSVRAAGGTGRERPEPAGRVPLAARRTSPAAGERHHLPLAPLPRRPGHLPDPRRRLDPRVELRGAGLHRRRRGRHPLRLQRPDQVRVQDPRRHERQLLRRRPRRGAPGSRARRWTRDRCGSATRRASGPRWRARHWACSSTRRPRWTRAASASTSPRTSATAASTASRPSAGRTSRTGGSRSRRWRPNGPSPGTRCPTRPRPPLPRASRCPGAPSSPAARGSGSTAASSTWPRPPTTRSTPTTRAGGGSRSSTTPPS